MKMYRIMIYECEDENRMQNQIKKSLSDGTTEYSGMKFTSYFLSEEHNPEKCKVINNVLEEIIEEIEQNT